MNELQTIRFSWIKITTDEFAVIEHFDTSRMDIAINIGFAALPPEHVLAIQTKCTFNQQGKPRLVIAVSGYFDIDPVDWQTMYDKEKKTLYLALQPARALASLTLSTLRGVLHAKTEGLSVNAIPLPPIDLAEIVKEPVFITLPDEVPA
ncbi:MAG: hypothetical protein J0H74_22145 [Chitinophagaceae bacterium]|nr:hypothetical protein [Chitinophagaceae bacterium]